MTSDGSDVTGTQPQPVSGAPSSVMTVTEFTGLLSLITTMLSDMEGRILGRLDENSRLAAERWARHDEDSMRALAAAEKRFCDVEGLVNAHLAAERDEDIELRARIQPVKSVAGFVGRNWRSIALAILSALGMFGMSGGRLP